MATSLFPPASDAKAQRLGKWEKPKGKPSALAAKKGEQKQKSKVKNREKFGGKMFRRVLI